MKSFPRRNPLTIARLQRRRLSNGEILTGVNLAKALGVKKAAVWKWEHFGVPPKHVLALERLTGIPRHVLRPDFYPPPE
jgi:hypothetical protein